MSAGTGIEQLIAWARVQGGLAGNGHIDENHRFKLRDMIAAIDAAPSSEPAIAEATREAIDEIIDEAVDRGANWVRAGARDTCDFGDLLDRAAVALAQSSTPPASKGTYQSAADCPLGTMHGSASTHGNASGVDCCDFCGFPADDDPAPPASKGVEAYSAGAEAMREAVTAWLGTHSTAFKGYWHCDPQEALNAVASLTYIDQPTPSNDTLQGRGAAE